MTDLQQQIRETVTPGSMTKPKIVDALSDEFPETEVKIELVEMLTDGPLEEHPEIEGVYRISE